MVSTSARLVTFLLTLVGVLACQPESAGVVGAPSSYLVTGSWGESSDELLPHTRLKLEVLDGEELVAAEILLVEGEISKLSARRLAEGDLPATIGERRVPVRVERISPSHWEVAPMTLLSPGEYALASLGRGLLTSLMVSDQEVTVLPRWGGVSAQGFVTYCADSGQVPRELAVPETDSGQPALVSELIRGAMGTELGSSECLSFPLQPTPGWILPPLLSPQFALEPTPLAGVSRDGSASQPLAGVDVNLSLGASGVYVQLPQGRYVSELRLEGDGAPVLSKRVELVRSGEVFLGPLLAERDYELSITSESASPSVFRTRFISGPDAGRVIINEVLANPAGPEPSSEWVEIKNVGTLTVNLLGMVISDGSLDVSLPEIQLAPSQFAVLVGASYLPRPEFDAVPSSSAIPVVLPRLGKAGISNTGEGISLIDRDGRRISSVPPLPAKAGVSWARKGDFSSDEANSFAQQLPVRATPGAENVFEEIQED